MAPPQAPVPPSPFLAPRRSSSYGGNTPDKSPHSKNKKITISSDTFNTKIKPEHKSSALGCTANLITAIVGAGIIGIPYAMRETGLLAGWFLILLSAILGSKSLRLLLETAKHVDATSYETLAETVFGKIGWVGSNAMMLMMSWGPMMSYLMLVKDTLGTVLDYDPANCLIFSSLFIILPLSLQRDMADLAKTSRISVLLNICLVGIIVTYSPSSESIANAGGFATILSQSTFRPRTCFIGLGIISFAFSCQHSSLIIAGSLKNPTRERWSKVSWAALTFCLILSTVLGTYGYAAYLEETEGNVLNNFPMPDEFSSPKDLIAAKAANVARCILCGTMFFVYPLESFVARHVIMTNLFQGREAHEGDDHAVLDRWDRRVATTIALYLSVLIPALNCDDVGIVLAWTGTVAATTLTYIGPGVLFIGVHGEEFLELVESKWGSADDDSLGFLSRLLWYLLLMPVWCKVASMGKRGLASHYARKEMMTPADEYRLGKVKHKREMIKLQKQRRTQDNFFSDDDCEKERLTNKIDEKTCAELGLITTSGENSQSYGSMIAPNNAKNSELQHDAMEADCGEEDPQDEKQSVVDFAVAIAFVVFGVIAFTAGIVSIYTSG